MGLPKIYSEKFRQDDLFSMSSNEAIAEADEFVRMSRWNYHGNGKSNRILILIHFYNIEIICTYLKWFYQVDWIRLLFFSGMKRRMRFYILSIKLLNFQYWFTPWLKLRLISFFQHSKWWSIYHAVQIGFQKGKFLKWIFIRQVMTHDERKNSQRKFNISSKKVPTLHFSSKQYQYFIEECNYMHKQILPVIKMPFS